MSLNDCINTILSEIILYIGVLKPLFLFFPSFFLLSPSFCSVPTHPHVYSNGDVCLNLLGSDWHSSLSVFKLCLGILSMLISAKRKAKPQDDFLRKAAGFFFLVLFCLLRFLFFLVLQKVFSLVICVHIDNLNEVSYLGKLW